MDIKAKFLELTKKTYPLGTEKQVYSFLPDNFIKDKFDNLYWIIGKSDTLFCSHLDTVDSGSPGKNLDITHVIEGNMIKTDGKTILGADDKAGVAIMLYMIEKNIPGFYLFTVGEEKGCVGSSNLSKELQNKMTDKFKDIKKIIAFDRSGYNSVITHQMEQRCCSDEFAYALIDELKKNGLEFTIDTGDYYCDSAEFADLFPECTNLSVGYFYQHTSREVQNIEFLEKLAEACCKINWSSLPAVRDYSKVEYIDTYKSKKKKSINDDDIDDYDFHPFSIDDNKDVEVFYFKDNKFNYISDISYLDGEIIDITLSQKRVEYELDIITEYMEQNNIEYENAIWDGLILVIEYEKNQVKMSRGDLLQYCPELDIQHIKK
jgi:hypothetical protein